MTTADRPAEGLVLYQPRRGFRYGSESFWLVGFALESGVPRSALDLGTGSGVMAFLLARRGVRITGVDLREEWSALWEASLSASLPQPTLELICADVTSYSSDPVELIISNPPFFSESSGPIAPDPWKAAARTESVATLADFVRCAERNLLKGGRACFVIPVDRLAHLIAATHAGFGVQHLVQVGRRRVLVQLGAWSGVLPPIQRLPEDAEEVLAWVRRARGV